MRMFASVLVGALISTSAWAQSPTTQTGSATKGTNKIFTFTPAAFGQYVATLSWDAQGVNLLMVMACGTTDPFTYGIGAGLLDRFARFEAGVIAGEPCAIAVSSADGTANFRLHITSSGAQSLTPQAATGFSALTEARDGTFLGDEAVRALNRVRARVNLRR
jgi:hypothetical protein